MKGYYENGFGEELEVLNFFADGCAPCQVQFLFLNDLEKEMKGSVRIAKIDVDENPDIAKQFKIKGIPTVVLLKNGKPVWQQEGVVTTQKLMSLLEKKTPLAA